MLGGASAAGPIPAMSFMPRTPFSQAIHRSMQRQLRQFKQEGKIGNIKPANMSQAREFAAQNAYARVKTDPGSKDTPPRKES